MKRISVALVVGWVMVMIAGPSTSLAQGTGEFLCSAGSRDGQTCLAFSDCPGGVCVIAQGVCADGSTCVCPGGGQCVATPACASDTSFGTCIGGVADGVCCATGFNCPVGDTCVATQRVCAGGSFQGFPCTTNAMCNGGQCVSNGFVCEGGSADFFPCVTNEDCPGGICDQSFVNQPTNTPVTPAATAGPNTPTSPPAASTNTPLPFPTIVPGTPPTSGPVNTATPVPPTATFTPVIGTLALTTADALVGANKVVVDIDPTAFPVQGVIDIDGFLTEFTRRRSSRTLDLRAEFGLPFDVPAGSVVRVVEFTPTPGRHGQEQRDINEGRGCAVAPPMTNSSSTPGAAWLALIAAVGMILRRRSSNA